MRNLIFFVAITALFLSDAQTKSQAAIECRVVTRDTEYKEDGLNSSRKEDWAPGKKFWAIYGSGCGTKDGRGGTWCKTPGGVSVVKHRQGNAPIRTEVERDDTKCLDDPDTVYKAD